MHTCESNLNFPVWVRLTDRGREIHRDDHRDFWESIGSDPVPEYVPPKEDHGGWSEWQMWRLMMLFGPWLAPENDPPFDAKIRVEYMPDRGPR